MPVINLPRDTRGSELGTAIAGATKSLTDAYMQREAAMGVAQILEDPSIAPANKPVEALKKFGETGYEFFKKFQQTQLLEAQMKNVLADAGLADVRAKLGAAQLPVAGKAAEADLAATIAKTQDVQSQTTTRDVMRPGAVALQGAQTAETQTQADLRRELIPGAAQQQGATTAQALGNALESQQRAPMIAKQAELEGLKVEQARASLQQQAQLFAEGGTTLDNALTAAGIPLNSPEAGLAKKAYVMEPDPAKKWSAFQGIAEKAVTRNAEINKPQALTPDQSTTIKNAEVQLASAEKFLGAMEKGAGREFGLVPNLASVKAFAERYGVQNLDPNFLEAYNASLQQMADVARSGSQFYSTGVLKLARDVTPNIQGTALHAMMAANENAVRQLAALRTQKDLLLPGQPKAPFDAAIKKYEELEKRTAVESYTSTPWTVQVAKPDGTTFTQKLTVKDSPDPPPPGQVVRDANGNALGTVAGVVGEAGPPKTVVMWQGNQVDPKNLAVVIPRGASYKVGGQTFTGAEIIDAARGAGVTPEAVLEGLRASRGGRTPPAATAPIR